VKANLVAVQAKMSLEDYASAEAFQRQVTALMKEAVAGVDLSLPTLVAFPEAIGMYLSFVPYWWDEVRSEVRLESAVAKILEKGRDGVAGEGQETPLDSLRRLLFIEHALETERAYTEVFSSLAREHGVYLSAGSIYLPRVEESPHREGRFLKDDGRVYNTTYLFAPSGRCLLRTRKVNVPEGEDQYTDGGPEGELIAASTTLGRVATLICWDAFHHTLIERCDALGASIVLQPSYYSGAGPLDQLDPWSFISMIQGRENIRFGVAAFLVGAVFEDVAAEGLSYVARNTGRLDGAWQDAVLAIAEQPDAEAIVAATVEVDDGGAGPTGP
jgi:predicted amidohydrolase